MQKLCRFAQFGLCVITVVLVSACAGAPITRAIPTTPIAQGPGSLQGARRQLSGNWELVSFEALIDGDGLVRVPATGRLTYDDFGHLSIEGEVQRSTGGGTARVSSTPLKVSGRALIDAANSRLRVINAEGDLPLDEAVLDALAPDQFRYYEFLDDQLKLTVQDETGRTTSTTIWRRVE